MSSTQPPNPPPQDNSNNEKKPEESQAAVSTEETAMDTTPDKPPEETWSDIPEEILNLTTDEIMTRTRLIDNDLRVRTQLFVLTGVPKACTGDSVRDHATSA